MNVDINYLYAKRDILKNIYLRIVKYGTKIKKK